MKCELLIMMLKRLYVCIDLYPGLCFYFLNGDLCCIEVLKVKILLVYEMRNLCCGWQSSAVYVMELDS